MSFDYLDDEEYRKSIKGKPITKQEIEYFCNVQLVGTFEDVQEASIDYFFKELTNKEISYVHDYLTYCSDCGCWDNRKYVERKSNRCELCFRDLNEQYDD